MTVRRQLSPATDHKENMTTENNANETAKPTDQILKLLLELIPTCTESVFKAIGSTVAEMKALDPDLAAQLETAARTSAHLLAIGRWLDAEQERRQAFERRINARVGTIENALSPDPV